MKAAAGIDIVSMADKTPKKRLDRGILHFPIPLEAAMRPPVVVVHSPLVENDPSLGQA
jgi:hypothetical protein